MIRLLNLRVRSKRVPTHVFEELRDIFPEATMLTSIDICLPDNDTRVIRAIELLDRNDIKPLGIFDSGSQNTYHIKPNYEYEEPDYDKASHFVFTARQNVSADDIVRLGRGQIEILNDQSMNKNIIYEVDGYSGKIVSDVIRNEFENQSFVGLEFLPAKITNNFSGLDYWQISSTFKMPPLHRDCVTLDRDGNACKNDTCNNGCFLVEGRFPAGELNYHKSDIDSMESFDFSLTHEMFGNRPSLNGRKLVVSSKARDFISSLDPDALWIPVYEHE